MVRINNARTPLLFTSNTILNYYIIHAGLSQSTTVPERGAPNGRTTELLEPSFADAIVAIEKAIELPAFAAGRHWTCSVRQIAKASGGPVESIAARWGAVALKINQLHHAGRGVEWKTLANHKANAKAAVHWFRKENELPAAEAPPERRMAAASKKIVRSVAAAKLSGLMRYCSMKGVAPEAVNEAIVDQYMR